VALLLLLSFPTRRSSDLNETVLSSALILVPITLLIAVILPGNSTLPFGDLATIPYMIAIMAAVFGGDIFRTLIGGVVDVIITLRSEEHTSELQSRFDLVC